uniref:Tumor necrosis factor receptor superfamily member 16 n=1 Tax=Aquila chrysaetos chrysaetos TaxID=223781 RepID=A0A663FCA2_AQUCH
MGLGGGGRHRGGFGGGKHLGGGGRTTAAGGCCTPCPPGFGVTEPCGHTDTRCQPCTHNRTFSAVSSAVEPCQPCTPCPLLPARPCTPARDTLCTREWHPGGGHTHTHTHTLVLRITGRGGGGGTENWGELGTRGWRTHPPPQGSPKLWGGHPPPPPIPIDEDLERTGGEPVTGDPSPVTPEFVPPPPEATGKDIIPVYCSLLAAVVVGLLAYVAFKCWHTCRQKQQLAKARAGDLGTSPEGEKLHSDSGVFLDTHSLQEPHHTHTPVSVSLPGAGNTSAQRQEELERLLESGGPGGDWRSLATRLGFGPDAIGTFGRGRAPARTLLSAWAGAEGATLETLCQALVAIGRQDAARRLAGPGDATSAV